MTRLARTLALLTVALGLATGLYLLFGPTYSGCEIHQVIPTTGATPAPQVSTCFTKSLIEVQPIWPLPLVPILVWSLAPLLAFLGVRRRIAGRSFGTALIVVALVLEATVIISFGAAPLYVPFVLLPLVLTSIIALRTPAMR